ncbi:N-acetylmuramoyl-L-alanine amidase [Desulfosporosinus sp. BICA1-9]|uniref:N-acetylmuramoyl-L-alanine amidase n=1 Tax=Desulfosporosinus sp. BICA1-9 TaxID=1531958 RepID=UPI00054BEDD5|nr:N-acetylmuramoyl-L-alanine amidase [Desulfosporosinus sp. BICA1-9]KJS47217.1 MAG: sporulation protein [Peptococcaceae bacterium BRH_c23]KJS84881.1 MAG: sporulation protein [Desulfosporosinus sp. BICA1-9]HBW37498.1 sporulation protein [Desulfosporosinus sp.]
MILCIDPGHGGYDTGAVGNGLYEKDLALDICLKLRSILEYNGIKCILTREGDYAPGYLSALNGDLSTRVKIAEEAKADLFISVHINAGGGTGVEVLISGRGGRAETAANKVLPYLVQVGGWANRGVKTQNVLVLRETSMPAILTENGFIDNIKDIAKVKEPNFRQSLAVAHAKGICDYFGVQYKEPVPGPPIANVMYRVILDGRQTMALSSQESAITVVKEAVDSGQSTKGVVQRTTDAVNVFEYVASLATQKTPIMGMETITLEQCRQFLMKHNPYAPDIVPLYKSQGELLGIRWGYAVAQMIKETGYLKFSGDVKAEQNNFAGIGAVGGGVPGASFSTQKEGVLAHLEHLFAYASIDPLPVGILKVDPRFDLVKRGSCPNWEDLNGNWVVPGKEYGEEVVKIYENIAGEEISSDSGETYLLRKIFQVILDYFKGKNSDPFS